MGNAPARRACTGSPPARPPLPALPACLPAGRSSRCTRAHHRSRRYGLHRGMRNRPARRYRLHLHVVREDNPWNPEFVSQQSLDNLRRQRRRGASSSIDGHQDVTGHERRHAGLDRRAERLELDGPQPFGIMLDVRQVVMGVGKRVTMPGKCLPQAAMPALLQLLDDRDPQRRHIAGHLRPRRDRRSRCSSGW